MTGAILARTTFCAGQNESSSLREPGMLRRGTPTPHLPIVALNFCARQFSISELKMIREVTSECRALSLTEISRTLCELLDWKRPNGKLKNHECRLLLERLRDQGIVTLPALQPFGGHGPRRAPLTSRSDPQPQIIGSAGQFEPLRLTVVGAEDPDDLRLWAEYVERYHYLGHRVPVGASLHYGVHSERCPEQVLACLLWSSAAWKIAARDRWIGWSPAQRARNLPFIVNNSRFLLLPWVGVKGLASKILAQGARQLPADWQQHYGYRPLLLETLVEEGRFRGTCYRAANWIVLGRTQGRGRMDRDHQSPLPCKLVLVYPLGRKVQQRLCQATAPAYTQPSDEADSA
jgi:hypothetical protein